jgi:hypothetical protein
MEFSNSFGTAEKQRRWFIAPPVAHRFSMSINGRTVVFFGGAALEENLADAGAPGGVAVKSPGCVVCSPGISSPCRHRPSVAARTSAREHADAGIDVILDFDDTLVVEEPVKSPDVLLERAFPRNRHRQETCRDARHRTLMAHASYVRSRMAGVRASRRVSSCPAPPDAAGEPGSSPARLTNEIPA